MPTTSEIKNAIIHQHELAGADLTDFLYKRNTALSTHTAYAPAIKAWKKARLSLKYAQELTGSWVKELAGSAEWQAWLAPFVKNDAQTRTTLDDGLNAILADFGAHAHIAPKGTSAATVQKQVASEPSNQLRAPPPVLEHKDDGSTTLTDPDGSSVTLTPDGDVEVPFLDTMIGKGLLVAAGVGAAVLVGRAVT